MFIGVSVRACCERLCCTVLKTVINSLFFWRGNSLFICVPSVLFLLFPCLRSWAKCYWSPGLYAVFSPVKKLSLCLCGRFGPLKLPFFSLPHLMYSFFCCMFSPYAFNSFKRLELTVRKSSIKKQSANLVH